MKKIQSLQNSLVKKAKQIISGKYNSENRIFFAAEGNKIVLDALNSDIKPDFILLSESLGHAEIYPDDNTYLVSDNILKKISTMKSTPKVIGFFEINFKGSIESILKDSSLIVVLDRIQDPGNMGTIIRTSEAMGVSAIVCLRNTCSPFNAKSVRASMGSIFRLPIFQSIEIDSLFKFLDKNNFTSVFADMNGESIFKYKFNQKSALFFGQEGAGLSVEVIKRCKTSISVPMKGEVESLNVATSTAICLYEWQKQKNRV